MKSSLLVLFATFLVGIFAGPTIHSFASPSPKTSADTLRQLEGEFMKAAAERGSGRVYVLLRRRCGRGAEWRADHYGESEHR